MGDRLSCLYAEGVRDQSPGSPAERRFAAQRAHPGYGTAPDPIRRRRFTRGATVQRLRRRGVKDTRNPGCARGRGRTWAMIYNAFGVQGGLDRQVARSGQNPLPFVVVRTLARLSLAAI